MLDQQAVHSSAEVLRRTADRADGDAATAVANVVAEHRVGARLHAETIAVIVHDVPGDGQVVVPAQDKPVRLLREAVASPRIDRDIGNRRVVRGEYTEGTRGRVEDGEARYHRVRNSVQTEKRRASEILSMRPVPSTLTIQCARTRDGEILSRKPDERALPTLQQ